MANIVSQLAPLWQRLEQERGLPLGFMDRLAKVESSYNPNARNPNSSAGGLFQFINSTARNVGLADKFDPVASSEAAARLASDNAAFLRKAGIEPTAGNLYLAHQQGPAGAVKLLRGGDASASSVVGNAEAGLNGGAGLTANAMAAKWKNPFADIDGAASASPFAPPKESTDMAAANPADLPAPGAAETQGSAFAIPGGSGGWTAADNDQLMMALSLIANAIPNGQVAKDPGSVIKPWMDAASKREDRAYLRNKDARDFDLRKSEIDRAQGNADRAYKLQVDANTRADAAAARAEAATGKTDLIKNYEYDMKALEAEGKPRVPFNSWRENWAKASQPQTTINNTVNPILKGLGDQFTASADEARANAQTIRDSNAAFETLDADKGIISGANAENRLALQKLAKLFGVTDTSQIANTETFRAAVKPMILSSIKALGSNPSNSDRVYIDAANGGDISLDEQSIRNILALRERAARSQIDRHNTLADEMLAAQPDLKNVAPMMRITAPEAYVRKETAAPESGTTSPPRVKNKDEYDKLLPGTEYVDPFGTRRRKGGT